MICLSFLDSYEHEIFPTDTLTGENPNIVNPILMTALIILSLLGSLIFAEIELGFWIFMIGGIILASISPTFLWVCLINSSYIVMKALRKIIGE